MIPLADFSRYMQVDGRNVSTNGNNFRLGRKSSAIHRKLSADIPQTDHRIEKEHKNEKQDESYQLGYLPRATLRNDCDEHWCFR
jgi:hypothetical protein